MDELVQIVKSYKYTILLTSILVFSFITKSWNLSKPDEYYFDEIYYGFTAEQYTKGNMDAWVFDTTPPKGFAYTWDHPPAGKLVMAGVIKVLGISSLSRRAAPLIFGTFLPLAVYFFYLTLFPGRKSGALIAALLVSLEGLVFSMSRIALIDVILTFFIVCSAMFLWKGKIILGALLFGLAVSTKWTGIYLLPVMGLYELLVFDWRRSKLVLSARKAAFDMIKFVSIGVLIYLLSYTPLLLHFGWGKFIDLQKQMYWYHTNLKATHPYQSKPYQWPFNYKPVWMWVKSGFGIEQNIYAMGNPLIFWTGVLSVVAVGVYAVRIRSKKLTFLLACYFIFWLPWVVSPRLMFLYHYLPSVPFMIICTALVLDKLLKNPNKRVVILSVSYIITVAIAFIYLYPCWTGLQMEKGKASRCLQLSLWR